MKQLACTLVSLAAILPAQIIPVTGGGSALANAIATAPAGAVLVVAPGTYFPFTATGHLTVVAPLRATIQYSAASPGSAWTTATGVSAAEPMHLVGFDFLAAATAGVAGKVTCTDVHLEDCTAQNVFAYGGALRMADCTIVASKDAALSAYLATLAVSDCSFTAGTGFEPYYGSQWNESAIQLTGSVLRAERIHAQSGSIPILPGFALSLHTQTGTGTTSSATVADSDLLGGPYSQSLAVDCMSMNTVTLANTTTQGVIVCTQSQASLATLRWSSRQWTPGGTSTLQSHHLPSTITALVVSLDAVPFASPLLADLSFVGSTPNWWLHAAGVSDMSGDTAWTVALPASSAIQYASAWLHTVSLPGPQLHLSAPLGGLVR